MTQSTLSADVADEIEALRFDLDKVSAAIPIIGKAAAAKAKEISVAIEDAQERYAQALTEEVSIAHTARMAAFSDVNVTYPDDPERSLLRMPFTIHYTKLAYDSDLRTALPKVYTVNGFIGLPDDAYEYLVTEKPEAIPSQIMALAPGDPHEAMSRYFMAVKRGAFRA